MNISNFENQINETILERGYDYFTNDYITSLQKLKSGKWQAKVEGNYGNYRVEVLLDKVENITDYSCNCPFEGDICKHITAVLYAIRDRQDIQVAETVSNPPEWETIIRNTPEKKLKEFLLKYANENTDIQNELVVQLSDLPQKVNTAKYEKIVAKAFNSTKDRHGFIGYHDAYAALHPINNLLDKAGEHIGNGNYHEAFSIVSAVAPQCIEAIQYMDDSNGECGDVIGHAFDLTGRILDAVQNTKLAGEIFDWLHKQVQNPDYDDYGCGDDLEPLFFDWAVKTNHSETAYQFIEQQLKKSDEKDGWTSGYRKTKYLKFKIQLLNNQGKAKEADQIIEENLHLSDFREMRITQALSQGKTEEAIDHIKKGITQAEKDNHAGIVHRLKDKLLEIYEKQRYTNNIRTLSKELFLDNTNSIEYYRKYKATFTKEDWSEPCTEIIKKLSKPMKPNYWGRAFRSDLVSVFIEEAMWNELFNEVKQSNDIRILENYYKYLATHFPNEMIPMYKHAILKFAENTGRDIYVTLVQYLKNMAKLNGGEPEAINLKNELLEKYKNRPAMKEEFKKLNW